MLTALYFSQGKSRTSCFGTIRYVLLLCKNVHGAETKARFLRFCSKEPRHHAPILFIWIIKDFFLDHSEASNHLSLYSASICLWTLNGHRNQLMAEDGKNLALCLKQAKVGSNSQGSGSEELAGRNLSRHWLQDDQIHVIWQSKNDNALLTKYIFSPNQRFINLGKQTNRDARMPFSI